MKKVVESNRLIFRELLSSDAKDMFKLNSDPDVVKYTGDMPFIHIDQARKNIEIIRQQYLNFGIGRCAAILKETNEFIGWAGLKYINELNGRKDNYDLGYRFLKRKWGMGYGTESAKAFVRYGFSVMQLKRISAYADVEHIASLKLLEKCGFKFTNTFMDDGDLCAWYEIEDSTLNCNQCQYISCSVRTLRCSRPATVGFASLRRRLS